MLLHRPLTGQPRPSLVSGRRRGQYGQRAWSGNAQPVPPVGRRGQPGKGADRHHGQRRLSLRPVMRGDDPEGQLTAARVSGEHHCPGHAFPRRPARRNRHRLRGASHLQRQQPRPQLPARQDHAANMPALPATAPSQDSTGLAEPGKPYRPAVLHWRRTVPIDPREADRPQILIEPQVTDLQQRQIDPGRLIADQHHRCGQLASRDGPHQQLPALHEILPVIDSVRRGQHQSAADQVP